jgi:hypothetical protein
MRGVVGALIGSALVAGSCKPGPPEDAGSRTVVPMETAWRGLELADEDWVTCLSDIDCTLAEVGCCDHCNGGRALPARKDHAADVVKAFRESCDDGSCGEVGCQGPAPVCHAGRCAFETR